MSCVLLHAGTAVRFCTAFFYMSGVCNQSNFTRYEGVPDFSMDGLIKLHKETMSSLEIAELTGKRHDAILRDIRNLLSQGVNEHNFVEVEYVDRKGEKRPCFNVTKKGCLILASGYDALLREKIINRWEELELKERTGNFQIPQTYSEALMLAAKQAQQIEEQQKQIEQAKPKVLFAEAVSTSKRSCLIAELAKILQQNGINIGQNRLFSWMRENGYLCSKGQYYNQPTQKAQEMGLFEIKQTTVNKPDGSILVSTTTKVSGKGQIYFVNKFLSNN